MTRIRLHVNDRLVEADVEPRTHLADFLRDQLLLTGTHIGCEHGICGACTVEIDGEITRSCITYAASVDGAHVRTVEGFDDDGLMERLRRAFQENHALQCGYCTPGMLVAARDLVRRKSGLTHDKIRMEMSGNLCRCTGYMGIVAAISDVMADGVDADTHTNANRSIGPAPGPGAPDSGGADNAPDPAKHVAIAEPLAKSEEALDFSDESAFTTLEQSFQVNHPKETVWKHMADIGRVARAMPGVELDEPVEGDKVSGRIAIKLGPISASFAGHGRLSRDDESHTGIVEGAGLDQDSASRARGRVTYTLIETNEGGTQVDVKLAYALAGPLAQFSRGGLVKDVVARLADAFAQNLEAQISSPDSEPVAAAELKAGSLIWSVIAARLRGLWRRLFGT